MGISDDISGRKRFHHSKPASSFSVPAEPVKVKNIISEHKTEPEKHQIDSSAQLDNQKNAVQEKIPVEILSASKSDASKDALRDSFFSNHAEKKSLKPSVKSTVEVVDGDIVGHQKRRYTWIFISVLALVLVGVIVYQNYSAITKLFGRDSTNTVATTSTTPTYEGTVDTQDQVVDSAATTTPAATAPATTDKSTLKVEILNGNGITGTAAAVKTALTNAGYTISRVTNAKRFTYATSIIYYKTGQEAAATEMKTILSTRTVSIELNDLVAGAYDLVLVVGKK